jgi:cellulose synthase/poly-beta-1,6-N-acetylglucosamine synthase-like glycosyltransferase
MFAIFDADFVPPPHFLKAVLPPLLADPQVAVVQTAWGHLNAEANWLTRGAAPCCRRSLRD